MANSTEDPFQDGVLATEANLTRDSPAMPPSVSTQDNGTIPATAPVMSSAQADHIREVRRLVESGSMAGID